MRNKLATQLASDVANKFALRAKRTTTTGARESPRLNLRSTRIETVAKYGRAPPESLAERDIASGRSRVRCARSDDGDASGRAAQRKCDGESARLARSEHGIPMRNIEGRNRAPRTCDRRTLETPANANRHRVA